MSKRILVVEDQPDNRQIIRDMLAPTDYEITEAENGEEALAAITKQRPDLILMDIQLPIMDGYTATSRIKADPTLRSIPMSLGARSCRGWRLCHSEKSWPLQAAPNPVPPRIGRVGAFLIRCFGQLSPHSRRERKLASSPLVAWISGFDLTATSTSGMPYRGRP